MALKCDTRRDKGEDGLELAQLGKYWGEMGLRKKGFNYGGIVTL